MIRLSIVIPFYNVEKYIAECLDSVYNQDIPEDEYEVICVNDASPDNSRDIVLEYQKKHSNLILVEHEVNKKLGAARNTGRRIAQGKYIWNVDSDDMIVPNCLGEILNTCEQNKLDVLVVGFWVKHANGINEREKKQWDETDGIVSGVDFWKKQVIKKLGTNSQIWTKVYRRDYLEDKNIFSPEIYYGEDVPFTFESIIRAERLFVTARECYIYRKNMESMTHEMKRTPSARCVYENCFECSYYLNKVINRIPADKEIHKSIRSVERWIIQNYSKFVCDMTNSEIKKLRGLCRKSFFRNRYVFQVLSIKQCFKYLSFIVFNSKPQ